ncbi:MAG: hypothetical protein K6E20_04935 [Acholeplasmatales bacterium]|nr:hypothetical protein [Acholeplasmatales bacterium]
MILIKEDFSDFNTEEFPYDLGHTALGEYHHIKYDGYYGNFYDPTPLHQWRSLDGSWLITEENGIKYLEQNRGDNTKGAFLNVYATLTHKQRIYSSFTLEYNLRLFEVNNYSGMAFSYNTSRNYYAVLMKFNKISLVKRFDEDIDIIKSYDFDMNVSKDYHFKIIVDKNIKIYLDNKIIIEANIDYQIGKKIAFVGKSASRFSNLIVTLTDEEYKLHLENKTKEEKRISDKKKQYSELECIKKINLGKGGSGRQLRIAKTSGKTYLLFAQHQKRYIRDSFAHLSSLSLFEYESGKEIWHMGLQNNSLNNTLISCDLPFQIADINNDGKLELIYAQNFKVYFVDLLTKKLIKEMDTPIILGDPNVKNEPFYRLNVDAIRVADFEGLGYKGDFIIKDRYQNVWAYNFSEFKLLFRYHNKNTGHFPYIDDINNDGYDEILIGYDLLDHEGNFIWSLPMESDHTDEIIFAKLHKDLEPKFILASGNEGMNIINMDGSIYKHNEIGHAQRISVAKYDYDIEGLQIIATAFWGSDGIIRGYDYLGNVRSEYEMESNGSVCQPVMYDGINILCLTHSDKDGGLLDFNLDFVVKFPEDGHPTLCCESYDIDGDGISEILCWNQNELWVYKAKNFKTPKKKYSHYPDTGFSNYRGEYLISLDDLS